MKVTKTTESPLEKVKHAATGQDEPLAERSPSTVFGLVGPVYLVVLLLALLAIVLVGAFSGVL